MHIQMRSSMVDHFSLLTLGLVYGTTVCSLSCLPYLGPLLIGESGGFKKGLGGIVSFMTGKMICYGVLGGLAARFGQEIVFDKGITQVVMAVVLIAVGLSFFFSSPAPCKKPCGPQVRRPLSFMTLGAVTGLTPCPPLAAVLVLAVQSGHPVHGILYGVLFGAGLMLSPMILAGGLLAFVGQRIRQEVKAITPYMHFFAAFIIMGHGLRILIGI